MSSLAAATRRRELAFAHDIGNEAALARDGVPVPRRSGRLGWLALVVLVLAAVGGVPLFGRHNGLLAADCQRPGVAVSRVQATAGSQLAWQAAGPQDSQYAVVLDSSQVTVSASGTLGVAAGQLLAGPFSMGSCRSSEAVFVAPDGGDHSLALFRRTSAAGYQRVAAVALHVS